MERIKIRMMVATTRGMNTIQKSTQPKIIRKNLSIRPSSPFPEYFACNRLNHAKKYFNLKELANIFMVSVKM